MINLKEELAVCLLRKGLSMRKIARILRDKGLNVPKASGLSDSINKKRVRFETVQEILDCIGYELVIQEKKDK